MLLSNYLQYFIFLNYLLIRTPTYRCIIISILFAFTFNGCGNNYEELQPAVIIQGQVNFSGTDGNKESVSLLYSVPPKYTPEKSWPLIVCLHGGGSNAAAFHDLWKPVTDSLGFVLLTPQGEKQMPEEFGWTWGDHAEQAVLTSMDIVRKSVHINPKRVYITGFSAGGRLSYLLGLKYSHFFHGLAALSAPFNDSLLPETKIIPHKFKVYISHGALEESLAQHAKTAAKRLRDLGIPVKYISYEGIGHTLPDPKESELLRILNYLDSDE